MLERLSRRSALSLIAGSSLLPLASALPANAQTAPIRVAGAVLDVTAASFYAQDEGFFSKVGLNTQIVSVANGAATAAAIAAGNLEFGGANIVALASAHENGLPFVWVAPQGAYTSKSPTAGMVVAKASSIRTPKDLEGKTVAVSLLKQLADIALHAWLLKAGVNASTIRFIEMPYAAMDAALLNGRIDCACIEEPVLSETLASNGRLLASGYDAIGLEFCEGAWVTTAAYAQANPGIVKKFADAIAMTDDWANKNHAATAKIIEKYGKGPLPPGVQRCFLPSRLRASDFQPVIDASAKFGVIKQSFDVRTVFAPGLG